MDHRDSLYEAARLFQVAGKRVDTTSADIDSVALNVVTAASRMLAAFNADDPGDAMDEWTTLASVAMYLLPQPLQTNPEWETARKRIGKIVTATAAMYFQMMAGLDSE